MMGGLRIRKSGKLVYPVLLLAKKEKRIWDKCVVKAFQRES
jgi:hypothetical protein